MRRVSDWGFSEIQRLFQINTYILAENFAKTNLSKFSASLLGDLNTLGRFQKSNLLIGLSQIVQNTLEICF